MKNKRKAGSKGPSTNKKKPKLHSIEPLGPEILWKYPGRFIVYSEEAGRVIGVGETEEQAFAQAKKSGMGGLWHSAYSDPPGELQF